VGVTRARTLAATGGCALALVAPATRVLVERSPAWLTVPWPVSALLVAMGGAVIALAWPVRQFIRGRRRDLDPLRAAAVVVFAKSCSLAGAGLGGAYVAVTIRAVVEWSSPAFHERAVLAGASVVASAWLCAAGQIGQVWCRLPPDQPRGAA
jgi:hypothetical protein